MIKVIKRNEFKLLIGKNPMHKFSVCFLPDLTHNHILNTVMNIPVFFMLYINITSVKINRRKQSSDAESKI